MLLIRIGAMACATTIYLAIGVIERFPTWVAHAGFCAALLLVAAGALRTAARVVPSRLDALLLVAAGLAWLTCSAAIWCVPAGAMVLGGAAHLLPAPDPRSDPASRRLAVAAGIVGIMLALQYATLTAIESLVGAQHEVPLLAVPVAAFLRLFGEAALANGGAVDIARPHGAITIRPAFEFLHVLLFAPAAIGLLLVEHVWRGLTVARVLLLLGAAAAASVAAFCVAVLIALDAMIVDPVLSAPLAAGLLCAAAPLLPRFAAGTARAARSPWAIASTVMGILLAGLCVAWLALSQPGIEKAGRVLIDESHSQWESTLVDPGTRWYGSRAGYNFFALRRFLANYFEVSVNEARLTADALDGKDVLVLKIPTTRYDDDEVAAMLEFVAAGGSLLLIGDHTNVFGSSQHLNQLAVPLGLRFRCDSQHEAVDYDLTLYVPSDRLAHPAFQPPYFLFGTGCTLEPAWWAERVVLSRRNVAEKADYSVGNFFFHGLGQLDRRFGSVVQVAASTYGDGRALAYTDSTVFSNFWMFMPGKPEAMLDMISWLNHRNAGPPVRIAAAILAGLVLLLFFGLPARAYALACATAFTLALPLAMVGVHAIHRAAYPDPRPHRPPPEVVFVREASAYFLPRTRLIPPSSGPGSRTYITLYGLPQRVGLEPREVATVGEALARNPRALVVLDPVLQLPAASQELLRDYVDRGGRLILCDHATGPALGEFAAQFGVHLDHRRTADAMVGLVGEGRETLLPTGFEFRPVAADRALALAGDPAGVACIAAVPFGRGLVIVITCGDLLEDSRLGADTMIPTLDQLRVHRLMYWLFRAAFDQAPADAFPPLPAMEHYFGEDPAGAIAAQLRAHQEERVRAFEAAGRPLPGAGAAARIPSGPPGEVQGRNPR